MSIVDLHNYDDLSGMLPLWEFQDGEYTFRLFSGNRVQVLKGDDPTPRYEVGPGGCSCPGFRFGGHCKHTRFSWVGEGPSTKQGKPPVADGIDGLL